MTREGLAAQARWAAEQWRTETILGRKTGRDTPSSSDRGSVTPEVSAASRAVALSLNLHLFSAYR